ncbi:MAG: AMP-binding protein [Tateyamaria sp.]|uniref:class I adenylate-forming enzyme family protein n=1 Tax=Tateyamaria sp. TaxID=1929288 RepID=UPI0032A018FB
MNADRVGAVPAQSVYDLLSHQAAVRPEPCALEDATGAVWSYRDLDAAARALAQALKDNGVGPGDRVICVSENCAAGVAALFATWAIRAVIVPVNARQTPAEIDKIVSHAAPSLVLFTSQVSPDAAQHAERLGAATLVGLWGHLDFVALEHESSPSAADVAVILYTTGTTGDPKGVMLTHENVSFGGATSAKYRGMTPGDLIYGVLPATHVFGLSSIIVASIFAGATVRLIPRFEVDAVFEGLHRGITLFSGVPQMHALLMAHARKLGLKVLGSDTLRFVSSGAAPLDPTWKRKAETFYGVAVQNGYGLTESTAGVAATHNALGNPDTSVGPALLGVEIAIDAAGPDGVGEVLTRGPHVMKGYFRNRQATSDVLGVDGWLKTGDLGRIDDQGRLHIVGRLKELIIHGGFNVYPPEVEAALNDHPDVVQAAVIGRRNGNDEDVLAFVQPAVGSTLDEATLHAFVSTRVVGYKRPAVYVFASSLPAAPTGKILKHKLISTFLDELN